MAVDEGMVDGAWLSLEMEVAISLNEVIVKLMLFK